MLVNRDFDNVWEEIRAKAQDLSERGVPIATLSTEVPNYIVRVGQDSITRSSDQTRSGGTSDVPRRDLERIWDQLARDGHTTGVISLRFAYALMHATLDGLRFEPQPFGLAVEDVAVLTRQWGPDLQPTPGGRVWWVNQGSTYAAERDGGYVWAPVKTKAGWPVAHHTAVSLMQPGEVVLHYANSFVRALGVVQSAPQRRARPAELDNGQWEEDGHYTAVRYYPLATPLPIGSVPGRTSDAGPFDINGDVKQGYMFEVSRTFAEQLRTAHAALWPVGSPWSSRPQRHWLFQANPNQWDLAANLEEWPIGGDDTWTVTRYREQMSPGDDVVLWQAGAQSGIYGFARLTGTPVEGVKPDFRPDSGSNTEWRVPLQLTRALQSPIPRVTVLGDPVLSNMSVIRQPNGTNFALTEQEWARITELATDVTDDSPLEDTLADLGRSLFLQPPEALEEYEHLLRDKQQLIFYGPPGTGKTFVAKKLAEFFAKDPARVMKVQFHASYAYEDFVEGYRPRTVDGQLTYEIVSGPLRDIAEAARHSPHVHVLLIDEINRGNLAKIFGELYYLLEYRDEALTLQYSRDQFALPHNLWIIGTMNTADRSIALVDAALRRRFHFVPFFPDQQPIKGLLRRWLSKHHPDLVDLADIVDAANSKLPDRNLLIGPSHFMRPQLSDHWVERIWEYSITPFVEEQFFGDADAPKQFTLDALRTPAAEPQPLDVRAPASEPDDDATPQPL